MCTRQSTSHIESSKNQIALSGNIFRPNQGVIQTPTDALKLHWQQPSGIIQGNWMIHKGFRNFVIRKGRCWNSSRKGWRCTCQSASATIGLIVKWMKWIETTFRRWGYSCQSWLCGSGRRTRWSRWCSDTPAPSAWGRSRRRQSGTAAWRHSCSASPEIFCFNWDDITLQKQTETSSSKNLSSKVFSPGLVPAPSKHCLYSL